jgi:glyoxylase-like metal-dependent hydrolase (beta-lactamase superfamily II)
MFAGRSRSNRLIRALAPRLIGFRQADRFTPDVLLTDGADLSPHGLEATIVSIPGHSPGSIGVLTPEGDFFCGDLLTNTKGPALNSLLDVRDLANRSAANVRRLSVKVVYPGHGDPFPIGDLP